MCQLWLTQLGFVAMTQDYEQLKMENQSLDSDKHDAAKQLNLHLMHLSALEQEVCFYAIQNCTRHDRHLHKHEMTSFTLRTRIYVFQMGLLKIPQDVILGHRFQTRVNCFPVWKCNSIHRCHRGLGFLLCHLVFLFGFACPWIQSDSDKSNPSPPFYKSS